MAEDLSQIPTPVLGRMLARVRGVMFGLIIVDVLAAVALAVLFMNRGAARVIPFLAPVLFVPGIILVPVVMRLGAISRELRSRG